MEVSLNIRPRADSSEVWNPELSLEASHISSFVFLRLDPHFTEHEHTSPTTCSFPFPTPSLDALPPHPYLVYFK
jgi:hypothetical protein